MLLSLLLLCLAGVVVMVFVGITTVPFAAVFFVAAPFRDRAGGTLADGGGTLVGCFFF